MARIHIVSSFHYDVLYLKNYEAYLKQGLSVIDKAIGILEKNPDYKFTIEQVILVREYYDRFPERRRIMRTLAQSGRLSFAPGMFVMPDMNMGGNETLFRQVKCGKEWLRQNLGVEPDACWIADCWGHHAQLPQMLRQCGYHSYFFWRGMRKEFGKSNFRWRGLDGTEIVTHWLPRGYSGIHFPAAALVADNLEEQEISGASFKEICRQAEKLSGYGREENILLCNGGDFCEPQESAPAFVRSLKQTESTFSDIRFSTPSDYIASLDKDKLDAAEGEFNAIFQGSYSSNIRIKQGLHRHTARLLALEAFRAVCGKDAADLNAQWEIVLKHCFHDTVCGTVTDSALAEVYRDLDRLDSEFSAGDALFNPTAHSRSDVFELTDGRRVRAALLPFETKCFKDLNAMPPLKPEPAANPRFRNPYYQAVFDGRGFISSLKSPGGREFVNPNSPAPFGGLVMQNDNGDNWQLYEGPIDGGSPASSFSHNNPDPLERTNEENSVINRHSFYPGIEEVSVLRSEDTLRVTQTGNISFWRNRCSFRAEIECTANSPLIRWKVRLMPGGRHYRIRAAFPTTVPDGVITQEIPFGLQQRGHSEYAAQTFCDYSGGGMGITLFNRGIPGNNVDEDGVLLLSLFRSVAMEYKCESAGSFNEGVPHEFEFAVMVRDGASLAPVLLPAEQYSCPPCEVRFESPELDLRQWELPSNIRISTVHLTDGQLFIRIYETLGRKTDLKVKPPDGFRFRREADALERASGPRLPISGELEFHLNAFEIQNLLLQR